MKNLRSTATALFAFFAISVFAQTQETVETSDPVFNSRAAKRKIVVGLKAGANHSNVFDAEGVNFVADAKNGFAGGAFLAIPFGGFLGFQPEILVSQKGFQGSGTMLSEPYSIKRTTTYLDVPLQLQLKPFRFLSLLGGVQYSYLLKQKDEFNFGPNSADQDQEFKNDDIRKNIFGAVTGFDINIHRLVFSGRAGWDIRANHGDGSSTTPRYKNLWLQGTVGLRFY
jgi:outer membrane protein with beta-barrel domain